MTYASPYLAPHSKAVWFVETLERAPRVDLANPSHYRAMSRLPRLRSSSPDRPGQSSAPTMASRSAPSMASSTNSLKRKAQENIGIDHQPRKLAAIAEGETNQPLRPVKALPNGNTTNRLGKGPPPLTKPRAPALSTSTTTTARRTTRATSAPPKTAPVRPPARPTSRVT